jgi:hypothetical protein
MGLGAVASYDGAEPSSVGKSGPRRAAARDVTEALTAGRFFRLVDGQGRELAIRMAMYWAGISQELAEITADYRG